MIQKLLHNTIEYIHKSDSEVFEINYWQFECLQNHSNCKVRCQDGLNFKRFLSSTRQV